MKLYKYMPLDPDPESESESESGKLTKKSKEQRDRIKQILADHKAFFTNPKRLNDIFECKPNFIIPSTDEEREKCAKHLIEEACLHLHNAKKKEIKVELIKDLKIESKILELTENYFKNHIDSYGIFCLSKNPNSPVMWSHYGTRCTGICIGFEIPISPGRNFDDFFGICDNVNYKKEYPVFNLMHPEPKELAIKTFFTKSIDWDYEEEYRFVQQGSFPDKRSRYYEFPKERITEIILGPSIKEHEREFIIEISKDLPNVTIYEGEKSTSKYSINKGKIINYRPRNSQFKKIV